MPLIHEMERHGNWLFKRRGYLPLIILSVGYVLFLRTAIFPELFFVMGTPYEIIYFLGCLLITLFGLAIRMFTVGFSKKNTSGRNTHGQVADSVNTTGSYAVVRHPLYLGNYFMWLGLALLSGHLWFILLFSLIFWIYYERIMFAEEQFMSRKFGRDYTDWAEKTPVFIPDLRKYTKPEGTFNWGKAIGNEKTTIMLVFLMFSIFDFSGEMLSGENWFNYPLYTLLAISIMGYAAIKIHKKFIAPKNIGIH